MATTLIPASHNGLSWSPPVFRRFTAHSPPSAARFSCSGEGGSSAENDSRLARGVKSVTRGFLAAWAVAAVSPVIAAGYLLYQQSPIAVKRAFIGNMTGQANGIYDKSIDHRLCDYTNEKSSIKGKSPAAVLMSIAKFDGVDMSEVVMSKAYAVGASFKGVGFSNAALGRVNFEKSNHQGALFKNTVLCESIFDDAQLQDAVFDNTIIGYVDLSETLHQ